MKSHLLRPVACAAAFIVFVPALRAIDADLGRFLNAKEAQIRQLSAGISNKVPALVWRFFDAVRVDDWATASNLAERISSASGRFEQSTNDEAVTPALRTLIWPPISECWGAYGEFHGWDNRWLHRFGSEIIKSIPAGSVYFGGTDPGRFVISALCESQVNGEPFFTITQNQLADGTYLDYLRAMYGSKLWIPTTKDLSAAFEKYSTDAAARRKHDEEFPDEPRQVKPGENIAFVGNRVQVSGQVAVMAINGILVKDILERNPQREFFIEESFALDWMYPYLTPHGSIFKLNHQPLPALARKDVAADRDYWKKLTDDMLGGWLEETTSVKEVCDFADRYGSGKHLDGFKGDNSFAANASARKTFSKLRSSIGGLYAWRAEHSTENDERNRLYAEADFAYRQSFAVCPYSPEVIYRYTYLLASRNRYDAAILIVRTALHQDPENEQFRALMAELMRH